MMREGGRRKRNGSAPSGGDATSRTFWKNLGVCYRNLLDCTKTSAARCLLPIEPAQIRVDSAKREKRIRAKERASRTAVQYDREKY